MVLLEDGKKPPAPSSDKLSTLKKMIFFIITHDLKIAIASIKHVLEISTNTLEIVQLAKVIKDMSQILLIPLKPE